MTNNQINYWKLQEEKRSHRAEEAIKQGTLDETKRHQRISEALEARSLTETERAHGVDEGERYRHNLAVETYNLLSLDEAIRAHKASEEIGRSNVAVGWGNVGVGWGNVDLGYSKIDLGYAELAHAQDVLSETTRHNETVEKEAQRHNMTEELLDTFRLNETGRHNRATEGVEKAGVAMKAYEGIMSAPFNGLEEITGLLRVVLPWQKHSSGGN